MLRVILIDDERPALRGLEALLKDYGAIEIGGMFTNPLEALERMKEINPQAVFLDINMPQLRGIDAASRILDQCPDTEIIFVTAYDQYALDAFEVHALDYLLKPLVKERLDITISRLLRKNKVGITPEGEKLEISCLGRFLVGWAGREPIKWRSEKTKELFAYMLQNQGRDISKEELLDTLWAEDDPDRAIRQLYNGIYYIRKALGDYGIDRDLIHINSNYHLRLGQVKWDVQRFHQLEKAGLPESIEELAQLAGLYIGDYLEGDYYAWADLEREQLRRLHLQCLIKLAQKLVEEHKWDRAESYLLKAYHQDPYEEDITELLLKLYIQTGNYNNASRHYNSYADLVKEELGIKPSAKILELVKMFR